MGSHDWRPSDECAIVPFKLSSSQRRSELPRCDSGASAISRGRFGKFCLSHAGKGHILITHTFGCARFACSGGLHGVNVGLSPRVVVPYRHVQGARCKRAAARFYPRARISLDIFNLRRATHTRSAPGTEKSSATSGATTPAPTYYRARRIMPTSEYSVGKSDALA